MAHCRTRTAVTILALALLTSTLAGCGSLPYLIQLAEGHFTSLGEAEPIEDVLASGRLSEDQQEKLELVVKARQFAVETIGLNPGTSYTTFYDTSGEPLAFSLSAARRDALEQVSWVFPIVGEVHQLTFFDEPYMREIEQELLDQGHDTMVYELDAYSSLGILEDPVRSTMLERSTLTLVETIIHEILHNTIWRQGDPVFNESLANFVGRQGAIEFLRAELGEDSSWTQVAPRYYADNDAVSVFLFELYSDLETYYAQPLSSEEKIAGREAVFQAARDRFASEIMPALNYPNVFAGYVNLPTNNAYILAHRRYNLDLDIMAAVYDATGNDWAATLDVFHTAARAAGDPFAYLRGWLAEQGG